MPSHMSERVREMSEGESQISRTNVSDKGRSEPKQTRVFDQVRPIKIWMREAAEIQSNLMLTGKPSCVGQI